MNRPAATLATPEFRQLLSQCIHCGLCLPACPTYSVLGQEMDSPRGRIQLMSAAAEGRVALHEPALHEHIDLCLGCRACESACPSGVHYGALLETTRTVLQTQRTPAAWERWIRRLALRELMPHRSRLRLTARLLRVAQAVGLPELAARMHWLPESLRTMAAILPPLDTHFVDYRFTAPALGQRRGRVAFLYGCVQDAFLSRVNAASVRVLQRNGYEVHFPSAQSCCGAAALHVGEATLAQELARRNLDALDVDAYDAILNNAGGCGTTFKEYAHLLADDAVYAEKSRRFVARFQDINEFLAEHLHAPPQGQLPVRVAYVDSCHLRHGQKVIRQPRQLLQAIPGLTLVELQQPELCCGSAGVYNITQAATAEQVLDAKMVDISAAGVQIVATANTGCHMQMIHGVAKAKLCAEVVHVVELLERSYLNDKAG